MNTKSNPDKVSPRKLTKKQWQQLQTKTIARFRRIGGKGRTWHERGASVQFFAVGMKDALIEKMNALYGAPEVSARCYREWWNQDLQLFHKLRWTRHNVHVETAYLY